jgi:hypothetical protein
MNITITRYKRSEIETAVNEKLKAGWECVGNGIVPMHNEKKVWNYNGSNPFTYGGRVTQQKFIVSMRKKAVEGINVR